MMSVAVWVAVSTGSGSATHRVHISTLAKFSRNRELGRQKAGHEVSWKSRI
jgi:hypothetical protein